MAQAVPMQNASPYPTVGQVLNRARVFALDAIQNLNGYLLASSQPYMPDLVNTAWERLQDDLIDAGVETMSKEVIISSVPPIFSTDPSVSVSLAWDGYCNGETTVETPNLPNDLILPSDLRQRPTGSGGTFSPVTAADGGLPDAYSTANSVGKWEWRNDQIWMNGATGLMDLKLRYIVYLPAIDITQTDASVPIMRCLNALAYCIAAEFADERGGGANATLEAKAVREISRITNRTARRKAVVSYRRQAFGR
jgi:hypothetical protein